MIKITILIEGEKCRYKVNKIFPVLLEKCVLNII